MDSIHQYNKTPIKNKQFFPGQFPDEKMVFLIRRHWSRIAKYIARLVLAHFIPIIVFVFLFFLLEWEIPNQGPFYVAMVMLTSLFYLSVWLFYIYEFIDYHLDIWVLTDKRIVSIEQSGLFKHTVSELNINKIQDVTTEMKGKVQTFMNFGNVYVQTASEKQRFIFEEVAHPSEVARQIIHAAEIFGDQKKQQQNNETPKNNTTTV